MSFNVIGTSNKIIYYPRGSAPSTNIVAGIGRLQIRVVICRRIKRTAVTNVRTSSATSYTLTRVTLYQCLSCPASIVIRVEPARDNVVSFCFFFFGPRRDDRF